MYWFALFHKEIFSSLSKAAQETDVRARTEIAERSGDEDSTLNEY